MTTVALHALDVPVALRLAESSVADVRTLADVLSFSVSAVHAAVKRLKLAGLVRPTSSGIGTVNRHALLEFLEHGVRYAFPGVAGAPTRGVPTAHAGPVFAEAMDASEALVWKDPQGTVEGRAVAPMLPRAGRLAERAPSTYALLTAVDALRIGRAREGDIARRYVRRMLNMQPPRRSSVG